MNTYAKFIESKRLTHSREPCDYHDKNDALYPFQSRIVERALSLGRSAIFADCGLGKTIMELEWGTNVPGRVLLLAPLAVAYQTEQEAARFGYDAAIEPGHKITLTNYEKLHQFDPDDFDAIILDESSILKAHTGKTRNRLIEAFGGHKYRLACTATPSPNDFKELGNHSEFLGLMTQSEMLSMFFVHDGGSTQDWRLKGHAVEEFWRWVGGWSTLIRRPSDIGYEDAGFDLPPLLFHHAVCDPVATSQSMLIPGVLPLDLSGRREVRRRTMGLRSDRAAELAESNPGQWLMWCDLNDESTMLSRVIKGSTEVRGSTPDDDKRDAFMGFAAGDIPCLVTKPRIGGWGMNWQSCHQMAFVGVSDSYEALYQATRRCWRFGQTEPVDVWLIYSESESAVVENVMAKERRHAELQDSLIKEAAQHGFWKG